MWYSVVYIHLLQLVLLLLLFITVYLPTCDAKINIYDNHPLTFIIKKIINFSLHFLTSQSTAFKQTSTHRHSPFLNEMVQLSVVIGSKLDFEGNISFYDAFHPVIALIFGEATAYKSCISTPVFWALWKVYLL